MDTRAGLFLVHNAHVYVWLVDALHVDIKAIILLQFLTQDSYSSLLLHIQLQGHLFLKLMYKADTIKESGRRLWFHRRHSGQAGFFRKQSWR